MPPFGIRVAPAWKADDKRTALGVDAHVHGLDDSTVADGDARRGVIDRSPGNARTGLLASRTLLRRHSASEWGPRVIWIAPQPGNRSLAHQPESSPHTGVGSRQVHEISRCAHFPDEARGCREDLFGSHLNVVRRLFRAHAETARHDNLSNSEERRARLNREAEIALGRRGQISKHRRVEPRRGGGLRGHKPVPFGLVRTLVGPAPDGQGPYRQQGKCARAYRYCLPRHLEITADIYSNGCRFVFDDVGCPIAR